MTTIVPSTTPTIDDLFDPALLNEMLHGGYVRQQVHPAEPRLAILNYTEKAAYEGQASAPTLDLAAPAVVTDKMDGSLGILYPLPGGGYAVATRGSFTSDQALHATKTWYARYAARFEPEPGYTYLFEIVYPENRIVCDYGDLDDLVMLGAVDIATGWSIPRAAEWSRWPGPAAQVFGYATLAEALAAEPRSNAEGLVVHMTGTDERVKLKQSDYVALHRIVTGLTARTVWEHMVSGRPLAELVEPLPDEFHPWVEQVAGGISQVVAEQQVQIWRDYLDLLTKLPDGWTRKEFAALAVPHPDKWALFNLIDGKDIRPELLKRAKPEPYLTPSGRTYGEDTA